MADDTDYSDGQPQGASKPASVNVPGGVRTDNSDHSYVVTGPIGETYHVSPDGDITGTVPLIRRVQIEDLSLVVRHDIANVYGTVSHTLHFVGGGVFSYLHLKAGEGMNIESRNVRYHALPDGVFIVCGTTEHETDVTGS